MNEVIKTILERRAVRKYEDKPVSREDLELIVKSPQGEEEIARCHELLQRTNQLNLSGIRYTLEELRMRIADPDAVALTAFCADRFGPYGQILYLDGVVEDGALVVREFAMSCRVAGKYVEAALVEWLRGYCDVRQIVLEGRKTERNGLLVRTFTSMGFEDESAGDAIRLVLAKDAQLEHTDVVAVKEGGL